MFSVPCRAEGNWAECSVYFTGLLSLLYWITVFYSRVIQRISASVQSTLLDSCPLNIIIIMSRVIQRISAPPPLNSGQDLVDLLVPFASILLQGCREHLAYLNKIACTQRAYTCTQRIQACEHAHLSTHVCMHTQTRMNPSPDKHGLSSFVYAPLQPLRSPSLPPTRLPHRHPPRPPAHMVLDHL